MATTPNLAITHIESNQSQKEVTANEAFDILDEAIAGELVHNMASDANYTLDTSEPNKEHENLVLHITDTGVVLTTTRDIIVPEAAHLYVAWNDTAQTLNFKTASGTSFAVAAGSVRLFYVDGTSYDAVGIADDSAGAGIDFSDLGDVPASYSGQGGKVVKVKGAEDGLEFVTESAATGVFWAVPHKGALVSLTSDDLAINATSGYTIPWDSEDRDTDAFVDLGAQATRITIPSGFSLVRFSGAVVLANMSGTYACMLRLRKNGTAVDEWRMDQGDGRFSNPTIQVQTPVIPVSASDYFELEVYVETDTSVDVKAGSWFQMEVMETTAGGNPPYDIGFYYSGLPSDAQEMLRLKVTRGFTIPDGATGSNAEARVASTGNVACSIKRNGTEFATVTFNASATGVFAQTGDETFVEDDVLTVVAPATADDTLEDMGFMLKGTRTT